MKLHKLLMLALVVIGISACQLDPCMDKAGFEKAYSEFIEDVTNQEPDQKVDWVKYDAKFERFIKECYQRHESEMTLNDKKQFWTKSMAYYHEKYGDDFYLKLNEKDDPLATHMKAEIEKVFSATGQDVLAYIKEVYGKDIESSIDQVVKEIEKIGEELKNILAK